MIDFSFLIVKLSYFLTSLPTGTYAVMSVMIGSVTERLAPDSDFMLPGNDTNSTIIDIASRDAERVKIAATVTFLSGIFQVGLFLSVCGFEVVYVTKCVVSVCVVAPRLGSFRFCGDVSLRAIGESLYNRGRHSCYCLPAQIFLWHQSTAVQRTFVSYICE